MNLVMHRMFRVQPHQEEFMSCRHIGLCAFLSVTWCVLPLLAQQPTASSGSTLSQVPPLIQFSNLATDERGNTMSGVVSITFSLYSSQQGGEPLWTETQNNVQLDSTGHYSVELGITQPNGVPTALFTTGEARWLGIEIAGQSQQPRVLLLSVPYALKAGDAATIGGLPPSAFVLAAPPNGAASAYTTESATGQSVSPATSTDVTTAGGTVDYLPLWDATSDITSSVLFQSATSPFKIGINTATPATTLDVKGAGTIRGTLSLPATGTATAAKGANSQPLSLAASSFNSSTSKAVNQTFQWQTEPAGNDTSTPSGTLHLLFGEGTAKPSETGLNIASNGLITFATGQTFPGPGTGSGTVTSVATGLGLTGGPITTSGTLAIDTTVVPQLNAANVFTGNQTVNGNVSATGLVTGAAFNIGTYTFAFGSYGFENAFLGFAGNTTLTGEYNTGSGFEALYSNTTGNYNTADGMDALFHNTAGVYNTADGMNALASNTTGYNNTASGAYALAGSTGNGNTANGYSALSQNTTGGNNTASGDGALYYNYYGNNNTALGYLAGPDSSSNNLSNTTAIGANAVVSESNALVLGGTGSNAVSVGIGTAKPAYTLDVQGSGRFTQPIVFAASQTFPGTGTITGVTAGTALTGGGSSGNVTLNVDTTKVVTGVTAGTDLTGGGTGGVQTLNLDTTKVPQLAAANTFSGTQTINNNVTINAASGYALTATSSSGFTGVNGVGYAGVLGSGTAYGVYGSASKGNIGVYGTSSGTGSYGLYGQNGTTSSTGLGVGSDTNIYAAGVWGDGGNNNTNPNVPGVMGTVDDGDAGVFANNSPDYYTVFAYNLNSSGPIFSAASPNGGCRIHSSGDLYCTGSNDAVVPIDVGRRKVALSAIESPKNWFEDFGSAQLSGGSAVVTLDPDFIQTVNTEREYMVIPVPNGECKGLYVTNKTATSFEVRELGGGTSSIHFDYRIVALRKNYENVRFADHTNEPDSVNEMIAKRHAARQHKMEPPKPPEQAALPEPPKLAPPKLPQKPPVPAPPRTSPPVP